MIRRSLLAVALGALLGLLPAAAVAAAPDTDPLRTAGWRVTWGSHGERTPLKAGSSVSVRVAPIRGATRRQRAVRVTLVRLADAGGPRRTVASAKVRRGLFRVRLPRGDGARYVLIVRAGRRTLRERLVTARRAPRPKPSAPVPAPMPPPVNPASMCVPAPGATYSASGSFDRPAATAGEQVTFTVANDGQMCLSSGRGFSWERLVDGAWQPVRTAPRVHPADIVLVWPGQTYAMTDTIESPVSMPPGRYRAVKSWDVLTQGQPRPPQAAATTYGYLDIVPGPNGGPAPDRCGAPDHEAAGTATLDRTTATYGEQLALTITNTGPVCLKGSDIRYRIDRYLPDGSMQPVSPSPDYWPDRAIVYQPGGSYVLRFTLESFVTMPAGRYRISYDLWVPPASDAIQVLHVQADFDVVAPPAG